MVYNTVQVRFFRCYEKGHLLIYPLIEMFWSTLRRVSGLVSSIYDANKIDQRLTNEKTRVATSILIKYNYSYSKIPHGEYWQMASCRDLYFLHNSLSVKMF